MVAITGLLSGFAVKDIDVAHRFYAETLGLAVERNGMGNLSILLPQGGAIVVYPKPDHVPATYTNLNL
jgi:extradiol dioxygenase family protein